MTSWSTHLLLFPQAKGCSPWLCPQCDRILRFVAKSSINNLCKALRASWINKSFFGRFGKTYHNDHNAHNGFALFAQHALLDLLGRENITVKKAEWVLREWKVLSLSVIDSMSLNSDCEGATHHHHHHDLRWFASSLSFFIRFIIVIVITTIVIVGYRDPNHHSDIDDVNYSNYSNYYRHPHHDELFSLFGQPCSTLTKPRLLGWTGCNCWIPE